MTSSKNPIERSNHSPLHALQMPLGANETGAAELNTPNTMTDATDGRRLFSSRNMDAFKNFFKKNTDQPDEPPTEDKIRAFHSIVSILAQIQQGPPFRDDEMAPKTPPNPEEVMRLRLSNAFAHLAVTDCEVVAATLYTPEKLTVMTWIQDQIQDQDAQDTQPEPEPKSKTPSLWDRICCLFTCNTKKDAMRAGSDYKGPCIVKATQPKNYPMGGNSSKENLLQYLDNFPERR